eukprot:12855903-Prorocentrum_lima.AAC.1
MLAEQEAQHKDLQEQADRLKGAKLDDKGGNKGSNSKGNKGGKDKDKDKRRRDKRHGRDRHRSDTSTDTARSKDSNASSAAMRTHKGGGVQAVQYQLEMISQAQAASALILQGIKGFPAKDFG